MFQEVWTHLQKEGKGKGDGFCNFCELLHTFSCISRKKGGKKELHVLLMKQRRWTDSAVFRQPQVPLVGSVIGE